MKTTLRRPLLLLVTALALTGSATLAHAAPKSIGKFKGTFAGDYASSASSTFFTQTSSGPTTAKFTVSAGGAAGKLALTGSDAQIPGSTYAATLIFKKNGTVTTDAVVPKIAEVAGSGRWKVAGSKITYSVTGSNAFGTYQAKGTVKGNGKKLVVTVTFTASLFTAGLPNQGQYTFTGK